MDYETENPELLQDPVGTLEEADAPKSKWELSPDGYYERWLPSAEEAVEVESFVYSYIRSLEAENNELLWEAAKNVDAYRGKSERIGSNTDEDPVMTVPLIATKVDQLVSFQSATILRPRPMMSVDPFFDDVYEVMSSQTVQGPQGPIQVGAPKTFDAEEVAATLEFGLDYKVRERMPIQKILKKIFMDLACANFAVLKVVHDQTYQVVRTNRIKRLPGNMAIVDGSEDRTIRGGDADKILNVNIFGFLAPLDCDLEDAELVCELAPMSTTDMREKLTNGEFFLPKREEWATLLRAVTNEFRLEQDRTRVSSNSLIDKHDTREVWFDWPVEFEDVDENGKTISILKRVKLCGIFHMGVKKFMTLYRNPYHHGRAPYVLITENEDSRRRPELSLVGRTRTAQALHAQMLHTNLANAYQASNFDIFCVPDTDAWDAIKNQGRKPGRLIPRNDKDEVEMKQAGANHPGLGQEIGLMENFIANIMGVSPYEEGSMIPGRTPADTVRQILQSGLQRPLMTMTTVSRGWSEAVKLYLRTIKQFNPYGELVPTKDPDTNSKIMVPFLLPVEEVLDNFGLSLTAADEEMAKEADQEQRVMLFNLIKDASQSFAQMAGAMADINASPALTALFEELFQINIRSLKLIIEPVRKDTAKFLPSDAAIQAIVAEKQQSAMVAMQQMQMQQAMGGAMPPGVGGGAAEGNTGPVPQAGTGAGPMGPMA